MEIKKIVLRVWEQSLLWEKKGVVFDALDSKKINIFLMPNTSWKSLIFNSLEHLFSYNKEPYIKDTNQDLEVEILFSLNWEDYTYVSNYYNSYKILKDWEEIKNFEWILKEYMWIKWEKLEYYWNSRNSLCSLNRFNFLDFSNLIDKETSNEIPFINAKYDWISRKFILAYILWAWIDWWFFKLITEYEYKKKFIKDKKSKFEKYATSLEQIRLVDNNLKSLFSELEDNRIIYWDISVAIKELWLLRREYIKTFWIDQTDEDYVFLNRELEKLEKEKEEISKNILKIREYIKWNKLIEWKDLVENKILKSKELIEFEKYNKFKEDLKGFDEIKIQNHLEENINPYINKFKNFLTGIYDIFVKKAIENKLIKEDVFDNWSIIFKENTLSIEALFKTSEGMRKTLRILTFVWLHIFSTEWKTKCLDYSFYDSFIENIDYKYRDILFDTIFEFVENNKLEVPKMYFLVTKIEAKIKDSSINGLWDIYSKYVNLIDSIWLK